MEKKDNKNIFITTKNTKNKKIFDLYKKKGLICFSVHIQQKYGEKINKWVKLIKSPPWKNLKLEDNSFNPSFNSLALLTGKKNGITVLDVDDIVKFEQFLKDNNQKEFDTPTALIGSGG